MYYKTLTLSFLFLVCFGFIARAQTTFCPPNLDFENGNLGNWSFYTGTCCAITTPTLSGVVVGRHTLTSGTGVDAYGGFPVVAPASGSYSLMLGNNGTGRQAERARYNITVPSGPGKYVLLYRYAVVFQNPNHDPADQPRFEVKAFETATNNQIACNEHIYVSSSILPGFALSTTGANVYYKPWTTATIDLTGYAGKTVTIDFTSGDCDLGGHFGYGYVDMSCGLFQFDIVECNASTNITVNGPPGYQSYKWMNASLTTVLGNTQALTIPQPPGTVVYALIVTPYTGFGCPDTFYTTYTVVNANVTLNATASNDTAVCNGLQAKLNVGTGSPNGPFTYKWWPSTGLSCATCQNPSAFIGSTTAYQVAINDKYGCSDTDDVVVTVNPKPVADAGRDTFSCTGSTLQMLGTGGGNYFWTPSTNLSSNSISNPVYTANSNVTYSLVVTNTYNCKDTDQVYMSTKPVPVANAGNDTTLCSADTITLKGTGLGTVNWSPSTYLSSTNILTPKFNGITTTYKLVLAIGSCLDTDEVAITVVPTPTANAGLDTTLCENKSTVLNGTATGGNIYQWTPVSNLSNPTILNPIAVVTGNISYILKVTNVQGCEAKDTMNVIMKPIPIANAGPDLDLCPGLKTNLTGSGGGTYKWYPTTNLTNPTSSSPEITALGNIQYFVSVTAPNGCSDTDDVNVTLKPVPVANAGNDLTVCGNTVVQLHGSGGLSCIWSPGTAMSSPTSYDPYILIASYSKVSYYLIVTNQQGCSDTDDVYIEAKPVPDANAGPDTTVCYGTAIQLDGKGGGTYNWTPPTNLDNSGIPNPGLTVRDTITYRLIVTNAHGCIDSDDVFIAVHPAPLAKVNDDTAICPGTDMQLVAEGGKHYQWYPQNGLSDPGIASPVAHIYTDISYSVVVSDINNCKDTETVNITVIPVHFEKGPDRTICFGDTVRISASGADIYNWTPDVHVSGSNTSSPEVWPTERQVYTVFVKDTICGRVDKMEINVDVNPLPQMKIMVTDNDCGMPSGQLFASGAKKYVWEPQQGLSAPFADATKATPDQTTRYTVKGTNEFGCSDTISAEVKVYSNDGRWFTPTAFTPNGDGLNDCYRVLIPGNVTNYELVISSRYGEIVFQTNSVTECWNGMHKGVNCDLGTYFYHYKATSDICGNLFKKGDITLVR